MTATKRLARISGDVFMTVEGVASHDPSRRNPPPLQCEDFVQLVSVVGPCITLRAIVVEHSPRRVAVVIPCGEATLPRSTTDSRAHGLVARALQRRRDGLLARVRRGAPILVGIGFPPRIGFSTITTRAERDHHDRGHAKHAASSSKRRARGTPRPSVRPRVSGVRTLHAGDSPCHSQWSRRIVRASLRR